MDRFRTGAALIGALVAGWSPHVALAQVRPIRVLPPPATLARPAPAAPHFSTPTLQYVGQAVPNLVTTAALHYIGAARPALERMPLGHPPNPN